MESLFHSVMQQEPSKRDFYIDKECGGDEELKSELLALLAARETSSFMREGAVTAGLRALEITSSLHAGQRLGPYEIEIHLASGGMGMVYRALDTRLQRLVAIKVLRFLEEGPELRARFQREAQSIAKLQHPNICAVHDVGEHEGQDYLVMEYLLGETLAERLSRGPLPIALAIEYATQMAGALDQAHKRGIIHRDLKPANVMITKNGLKLLDFGLASFAGPAQSTERQKLHTADGARLTTRFTSQGFIAGTPPYMAPEQLQEAFVDARTDLFAFGLIFYEMLAGHRAFEQRVPAELAHAIQNHAPSPLAGVPISVTRVIDTCLSKDPDERWQSAGDLRRELAWIANDAPQTTRSLGWSKRILSAVTVFVLLALMAAGWTRYRRRESPMPQPIRFSLPPPLGATYPPLADLAISPDGTRLVFGAVGSDGKLMLWVRKLGELQPELILGTERARFPFWSPDGHYLAFFSNGSLSTVELASGSIKRLCSAPDGVGGTWGIGGNILFAPRPFSQLQQVAAAGGTSVKVTLLDVSRDEEAHRWPSFLPDGRHFLFTAFSNRLPGKGMVYLGSLDAKPVKLLKTLTGGLRRAFLNSGRIYFVDDNPASEGLDPANLELRGDSTSLTELRQASGFSIARNGVIAYRTGGSASERDLVWLDRSGKKLSKPLSRGHFIGIAVSPNSQSLVAVLGPRARAHIWLSTLSDYNPRRFTRNAATDWYPVWSPDGKHLAYTSERNGHSDIFMRSVEGSGEEDLVFGSSSDKVPGSWSPDGKYLSSTEEADHRYKTWVTQMDAPRRSFLFPQATYSVSMSRFSPDGKWMAYWSDESGRAEVYITNFPEGSVHFQVSSHGGTYPLWRKDSKEIFYIDSLGKLMAVPIAIEGRSLRSEKPQALFDVPNGYGGYNYATFDGQKFLVLSDPEEAKSSPITIVVNTIASGP